MKTEFLAESVVSQELATAVMAFEPANPFCTTSYADALRAYGRQAWLLGIKRDRRMVAGCYGFLASGRMNSGLEIRSLPTLLGEEVFWEGLMQFCSRHRITCLDLDTRGSPEVEIPSLPGELKRQNRCDYIIDLRNPDWERKLAPLPRRCIRVALRSGLTLQRTGGTDACRDHLRLRKASMERRHQRGERGHTDFENEIPTLPQLTEKGAGELFQVVAGGRTLASALVLRAKAGAYLDSSGTSPEGMKCGASHFLIFSIARTLRTESALTFNLGAAEPHTGLSLFKTRFGATPGPFQYAAFYLGGDLRRKLTIASRFLRQRGSEIFRRSHPAKLCL